jgi:alcohol oxidase
MNYVQSSAGSLHISSPNEADAPPNLEVDIISDPVDISPFVWAYKRWREIPRRMPCFLEEVATSHPTFAPGLTASVAFVRDGANDAIRDVEYTENDNVEIERFIRKKLKTGAHSMSSSLRHQLTDS